jgi:signal transduction histidine kinase
MTLFRRLFHDTLFARIAGVLILNMLLVQLVSFLLFRVEVEHMPLRSELTERIATTMHAIDSVPPEEREKLAKAMSMPDLGVVIRSPADVERHRPPAGPNAGPSGEPPDPRFEERLQERIDLRSPDHSMRFWREVPPGLPPLGLAPPGGPPPGPPPVPLSDRDPETEPFVVAISLHDGSFAEFHPQRLPTAFHWLQLGTSIASICLVSSVLSLWAARRLSRSLARFVAAAEEFGRSAEAPPIPEVGPVELTTATKAFNRMQERLRRFVRDRTQMLAAISHDLRTPLTRMRLRAEFVDDEEQRNKMLHDIGEMESMISATMAFARDDATREPRREEDLDELVDNLCQSLGETGHDVQYEAVGPVPVRCSPMALKRALGNLLENATKYGQRARTKLNQGMGQVTIEIDDDGPGIPEEMQEAVFQPFFRLETSRNRDTGGVGLGLSVARTIIHGHGGELTLANRPEGGLRATVILPA